MRLIKVSDICSRTTDKRQAHTLCVLHPGVFAILLLNADPDDSPDYRLTGSNAACFVTLLCILEGKQKRFHIFVENPGALVHLYDLRWEKYRQ